MTQAPAQTQTLTPRPTRPVTRGPVVAPYNQAAYEASFDRFLHHADKAFGESDDPWLPRVPGPRQPSDYAGAA